MPCWQSLSILSISMAEIVSKEAQKKSKLGVVYALDFTSHKKATLRFLLSKRSTSCKSKTSAIIELFSKSRQRRSKLEYKYQDYKTKTSSSALEAP
ncbi:hypothetical protein Tco_0991793 [Tanacetum coccineum]|uniref:Uncharacterized protein n=1 Tax=Tanacetum coccineum TaxID=301880 RepID=A0ABQ5F115_9ASTR